MWRDLLRDALRNLGSNRARVVFTSLGVIWGVAMLTLLASYAAGFERHFVTQMQKVGRRIVYVYPGVALKERGGARGARPVRFDREDAKPIARLASVERVSPEISAGLRPIRGPDRTKLIWVYGVSESARAIRNYRVDRGRFISSRDVQESERVVFLGATAAERLFGEVPPVGRRVSIDGVPFRVIGTSPKKGDQLVFVGPKDDELAMVPSSTAQRWLTHSKQLTSIMLAPRMRELGGHVVEQTRLLLALHAGFRPGQDGALGFFNLMDAVALIERIARALRVFLSATGFITVVVGAIGVMNIMLISVSERVAEIGVRKALGASTAAIFAQFLLEAVVVTLASGIVGTLLGIHLVDLIAEARSQRLLFVPPPALEPGTIASQTLALFAVGVATGVVPALRAARIEPSVALRRA